MSKEKYILQERADGKDEISLAPKKAIEFYNKKFKGIAVKSPCIMLGRDGFIYALIWKHLCGEPVIFSIFPLRYKTGLKAIGILHNFSDTVKAVKEMMKARTK